MSFRTQLTTLMERIPGAVGVILADWEGESVDQANCMDGYELRVIGAHKGVILRNLREAMDRLQHDDLREMVITTEKVRTIVLPITQEYFLVLILQRGYSLGRALFEGRRCLEELRQEIG
jgi:predicted regulator of Ras-like GTPase activity (Roadblock/LC7/MglB family)